MTLFVLVCGGWFLTGPFLNTRLVKGRLEAQLGERTRLNWQIDQVRYKFPLSGELIGVRAALPDSDVQVLAVECIEADLQKSSESELVTPRRVKVVSPRVTVPIRELIAHFRQPDLRVELRTRTPEVTPEPLEEETLPNPPAEPPSPEVPQPPAPPVEVTPQAPPPPRERPVVKAPERPLFDLIITGGQLELKRSEDDPPQLKVDDFKALLPLGGAARDGAVSWTVREAPLSSVGIDQSQFEVGWSEPWLMISSGVQSTYGVEWDSALRFSPRGLLPLAVAFDIPDQDREWDFLSLRVEKLRAAAQATVQLRATQTANGRAAVTTQDISFRDPFGGPPMEFRRGSARMTGSLIGLLVPDFHLLGDEASCRGNAALLRNGQGAAIGRLIATERVKDGVNGLASQLGWVESGEEWLSAEMTPDVWVRDTRFQTNGASVVTDLAAEKTGREILRELRALVMEGQE